MQKTAIVTGASRGIGTEIAKTLAHDGYAVAVNYNTHKDAAFALCNELNNDGFCAKAYMADIKDSSQVSRMVSAVKQELGFVQLLVNNAGIAQQKMFCDLTDDDISLMLDVNIKGAMFCSREVLPQMMSRKKGRIINISSIWGEVGASCEVHYSAAKSALIGFTKALAKEYAPCNITVNCVSPGVISTDMLAGFTCEDLATLIDETPLARLGTPKDIADMVSFLASDKASFITGQIIGVNGGII